MIFFQKQAIVGRPMCMYSDIMFPTLFIGPTLTKNFATLPVDLNQCLLRRKEYVLIKPSISTSMIKLTSCVTHIHQQLIVFNKSVWIDCLFLVSLHAVTLILFELVRSFERSVNHLQRGSNDRIAGLFPAGGRDKARAHTDLGHPSLVVRTTKTVLQAARHVHNCNIFWTSINRHNT